MLVEAAVRAVAKVEAVKVAEEAEMEAGTDLEVGPVMAEAVKVAGVEPAHLHTDIGSGNRGCTPAGRGRRTDGVV